MNLEKQKPLAMSPIVKTLLEKKLVGKFTKMTIAQNTTAQLWEKFMVERDAIKNVIDADLYSIQVYDQNLKFKDFNPSTEFIKWACIEVSDFTNVPINFKPYLLEGGLYAVFVHRGLASDFHKTFEYIFSKWLPTSKYTVDSRAHFEVLSHLYKNNDSTSEEEVWIPIKIK